MRMPDGSTLMHDNAPYDPAKAHEYYLQYRQLHPRQAAAGLAGKGKRSSTFTVNEGHGKSARLTTQQLEEQQVYAAARVKNIRVKLALLNAQLKKKVAAAAAANKPMTAAQKTKAAQAAKQYAASHKQVLANKAKTAAAKPKASAKPKTDTIATLKTKITAAKASLTDAVAKQRELATAKKNG